MSVEGEEARTVERIEQALEATLVCAGGPGAPDGLAAAVRHAVQPGGARIRPRLCMAVSAACGEDAREVTDAAATAIELIHCASLVHDDLPCFDAAEVRRGQATVHCEYGERLAVLAGDALIVLAFQTLARDARHQPARLGTLVEIVGDATGMPGGLAAGQAWECESGVALGDYQQAKTGALFSAATMAGAVAAGADAGPWRALGERIGAAYQVLDDIHDVVGDAEAMGKPTGQDATHSRPSSAQELGVAGAVEHYEKLMAGVVEAIPPCPGRAGLAELLQVEARRLLPDKLAHSAA